MLPDRVKLTTEWVEWKDEGDDLHVLSGSVDVVAQAFSLDGIYRAITYPQVTQDNDGAYHYWRGEDTRHASVEEAKKACLDRLSEAGLVDPIWWAAQCLAE